MKPIAIGRIRHTSLMLSDTCDTEVITVLGGNKSAQMIL